MKRQAVILKLSTMALILIVAFGSFGLYAQHLFSVN